MAARVAAFDWSRTPLGPADRWPQSLKTAVSICLGSRFPMMLWWGPDLTNIYNDAFVSVLGGWHPRALGMSGRDVWADTWPVIGPQVAKVMEEGGSTLNERVRLVYARHGFPEETWFTWSFGPIRDEGGRVAGLFNTCHEDTRHVLAERERDRLAAHRQLALDAARLGWWHYDPATKVATFDERHKQIFGVAGDRRPNEEILRRLHPDDLPGVWAKVEAALNPAAPEPYAAAYRIVRDDGSVRWVEAHGAATFEGDAGDRRATSFVGTVADVTDRRAADAAAREAEERYRAVFEASWDAKVIYTPDGTVVEANPAACRIYGFARDEIVGLHAPDVIHPDARPMFRQFLAVAGAGGEFRCETVDRRRDGSAFDVEVHGGPLRFRGRAHLIAVIRDVSDRKRAADALRESEGRFRELADAMPQMVWVARPDGHHEYFNRRWYEFTGVPAGSTDGEGWNDMFHPDDRDRAWAAWRRSMATGEPYEIEYRLRHRTGAYRWTLGRALPVRDAGGAVARWFGTCTDIDALKRLQQEREALLDGERAARAEAERAGRVKDEFLATLSHELRTPLNAILGWAQILRRTPADAAAVAEGLETIERNARAQTRIIEDLLEMSRIVAGKVRLDVRQVALAPAVEAAVDTVRHAADAKGVRLEVALDPRAGLVAGDPARLQQVFWNLLSNSVKHTGRGGRIRVSLARADPHLEVVVADDGEGIPPDFLPFVFDRFRQADSSTTRRHGGLGLGLSIVKQLVELHGGTVRARSPGVGRGATFTVTLPVAPPHVDPEPADEPRCPPDAPDPAGSPTPRPSLSGVRVLVVDDEPDARALVKRLLEDCGAAVTTAGSAADALAALRRGTFDVLVSDVGMPGEDGHALVRKVRALMPADGGRVPAVALTAYARGEDRGRALAVGFDAHLSKPVEPADLVAAVAALARPSGPDRVGN